ncbi:hypothetical protein OWV82_012046 [Melia azedarach]|uniref:Uncharacterized protein n=1 Tax=Melia azedarach TaxID=155640 RepID=A0ACC1Y154_MELAZ|nr:hypothetical protein OWV82_012046 [Melia azedarach]
MAEGSKTDQALLDLVTDKMAKAARILNQPTRTSLGGPREGAATSNDLPPWPKRAKKVEGTRWTPQLATDLEGVLVTKEFPDLDLYHMEFGFDREALMAKFDKDQNLADIAGSLRWLATDRLLNLKVSPPHSDQREGDLGPR